VLAGNERLIVVLGMAHSGTTILTYVLKQHPDVLSAVNGPEAWILENDWLRLEQASPIQDVLCSFPNHRILLKRPWSCVWHGDWMAAEMPNARFLYCQREFGEIAQSWSKPTSFVDGTLRHAATQHKQELYQFFRRKGEEFGTRVPYFLKVDHAQFVEQPARVMAGIADWADGVFVRCRRGGRGAEY
jgi:hypothetical protein